MTLAQSVFGRAPFGIPSTGSTSGYIAQFDTLYTETGHTGNTNSAGGWPANTLMGTLMSPDVNVTVLNLGFEASSNGVGQATYTATVSVGLHREGGGLLARVDVPSQSYTQNAHYSWSIAPVFLKGGSRYWFTTLSNVDGNVAYSFEGFGNAVPHTHAVSFATFTLTQGNTKQSDIGVGYDISSLLTSQFINDTYHTKHIIGLSTVDPAVTITERSRRGIL